MKTLLEAHAALLYDSTGKQSELAENLASCEDKLDAMQLSINQIRTQGAGAPILLYDPQDMLDEIKSEIVMVRETLATRETDVGESNETGPAVSDSFTSAFAITSNLFAVMLSGTMIMSAHKLARQARDMSTVARNFEADVPLREHLVDQRSVRTGRSIRKDRDFGESCSSALTDAAGVGGSALGSEARTYQGSIYKKQPTALRRSPDERASIIEENETHSKVTRESYLTSGDVHIQTGTAEQSESCADQQSWDGIWNSSAISPLQQEPTAEEGRQPDVDYSVRKVSSSSSRLRDTC